MTEIKTIQVETHAAVAHIRLSRPEALNALNAPMRSALAQALTTAKNDDQICAVVLSGKGRVFSAGADLKEDLRNQDITRILLDEYQPSFDAITQMDKPVISAVTGSASGISLALALACDLTVMDEEGFLLCPFSTISLIPDGGCTFLLVRQMGYKRAFEMALEAQRLSAAKALELGLVNRLAATGDVCASALQWAQQLSRRAPLAVAGTKKLMRLATAASYADTFAAEARQQKTCLESDDFLEGRNAFLEKRKPQFKGR